MKYQVISPRRSDKIDPTVDFFIINDHMVDTNFSPSALIDDRIRYFGKNTIGDLFAAQSLDYRDYFFIFDTYLCFADFDSNGYFYPSVLLNLVVDYKKFSPQHSIDFTKKTHSINCVMNKPRPARLLASCWFANNKIDRVLYTQSWTSTNDTALALLDELLQLGGLIDWTHEFGPKTKILEQQWIDHQGNLPSRVFNNSSIEKNFFTTELLQIFDSTVISVVLEPVFWECGSIASEKYTQAIYGGTIPLVNGYRIYDSLNKLGFDTFSDIIDTSSQYELDPILRSWNMLETNKKLFSQWKELITDPQLQRRIVNNLSLIQDPETMFKNSIRLNSEQSLKKIMDLKHNLTSYGFQYLDMLSILD